MRKALSTTIPVVAAVVAASVVASAAQAGKGGTSFDVVLPKTNSTYVDTGKKGYTPGDYFLATGPVLAKTGGPRVGGLAGVWTLVSPAADKASIAIHLARGTVYVDGRIRHTAKQSVLEVLGGTDAFRGARGTATFRYLSETSASIRFELA
jgi:hypothetical protein